MYVCVCGICRSAGQHIGRQRSLEWALVQDRQSPLANQVCVCVRVCVCAVSYTQTAGAYTIADSLKEAKVRVVCNGELS